MKWLLILYALHANSEWSRDEIHAYENRDVCLKVAVAFNAEQPFEDNNEPYLACEGK